MKDRDWELLRMKPPSANHDPFHNYVTDDGRLTDLGYAVQNFAADMRKVIADRAPKKPKPTDERMNIGNQINLALNDIRETLVALATWAKTPDVSDQMRAADKARYQLHQAMQMILDYRDRKRDVPWADRKPQVEEEFS